MGPIEVTPGAPVLPVALIQPLAIPIGVHVPPALAQARADEQLQFDGIAVTYRHAIGAPMVGVLRQALQQCNGAPLADVEAGPPFGAPAFEHAALIVVPGTPSIMGTVHTTSVVTLLTQEMTVPLTLHRPDGTTETIGVRAAIATGAYGPLFTSQPLMDEFLLRNLGAAALVALGAQVQQVQEAGGEAEAAAQASTSDEAGGLAVLRLNAGLPQRDGIEGRVEQCLRAAFPAPRPDASAAGLRDALFPWLEPGIAPLTEADVRALLQQPAVRQRLAARGVGWLVLFTAGDAPTAKTENMFCGGGFGAGACFGLYSARSGYTVDMAVWNVRAAAPAAKVQASVTRTIGAVGVILPIPFTTSNAAEACERMQSFVRASIAAERGLPTAR